MAEVKQHIFIEDYNVSDDLIIVEDEPNLSAYKVNSSSWDEVLKKLRLIPNVSVYRREDLPGRWHFKRNKRIPEIHIIPEVGYSVVCYISPIIIGYSEVENIKNEILPEGTRAL